MKVLSSSRRAKLDTASEALRQSISIIYIIEPITLLSLSGRYVESSEASRAAERSGLCNHWNFDEIYNR